MKDSSERYIPSDGLCENATQQLVSLVDNRSLKTRLQALIPDEVINPHRYTQDEIDKCLSPKDQEIYKKFQDGILYLENILKRKRDYWKKDVPVVLKAM